MVFLIEYNRKAGKIIRIFKFQDSDRSSANVTRLQLELDLNRQMVNHEVVLLEAASEDALHLTHRRYFEDPRQFVTSTLSLPILEKK